VEVRGEKILTDYPSLNTLEQNEEGTERSRGLIGKGPVKVRWPVIESIRDMASRPGLEIALGGMDLVGGWVWVANPVYMIWGVTS
jgi:hypothetical protein